jgi:hypothetical protein
VLVEGNENNLGAIPKKGALNSDKLPFDTDTIRAAAMESVNAVQGECLPDYSMAKPDACLRHSLRIIA